MELIRGRWSKKYINSWEDKRDYDIMRRGFMRFHEKIASDYCKRFSPPELTAKEQQEISDYWAQYGIEIYDFSWHRMYYHATNNHDARFIPDLVVGLVIYEYYNDRAYQDAYRDKNMFHRLLPDVPLPKTLGSRIRRRYWHNELGYITNNADVQSFAHSLWKSLGKEEDIVVKNTRDTCLGKGVKKYHISNEADILKVLLDYKAHPDFIIQICVRQHKVMASFNKLSSNVLRICSWRHGNQVDILYAAVRASANDSFTDISFVEGEEKLCLVGISPKGIFANKMLDQYGHYVKDLPSGISVPAWAKITEIIKKNHLLMDNFDIIGWDFTVDENENPICFEWNIAWPGTIFYQFANARPLFGEKTEEILSFLKDEKNRDNYIPYYMRTK